MASIAIQDHKQEHDWRSSSRHHLVLGISSTRSDRPLNFWQDCRSPTRKIWGCPRSGSQLRPSNPKRPKHVASDKGSLRLAKTPDQALAYITAQFGGVPSRTRAESLGPATPMPDTMAPLQFPASCLNSQRLKPPSSVTPVLERLVAILWWSKLMRHLKITGVSDRALVTGNLTFGRDHDVLIAEIITSSAPRTKMNAIR